jgi:hypothetical protein
VGSWLSHSRASHNPGRDDDFRDRHDFEGLVGRIVKEWSKLAEFTRTLPSPIPSSTRVFPEGDEASELSGDDLKTLKGVI